jgi:4-hydroxymandelate oxidase
MFVTGPPATGAGSGLRLRRTGHRVFTGPSELAHDPALRPYVTDLAGRYGLAVREEVFGAGQSYAEMARPLVESVTSPDAPVDLLVLAFGVHDVQPGRAIALDLASHCPGAPLAFALCDQGPAVAFTALRTIAAHAAAGGCGRALLLVAEQAAVHYPLPVPGPVPDLHAVAALLFEAAADAPPVRVRQLPGVVAEAADAVLAAEVAELAGERTDVTLATGEQDPGLPYTGLWSRPAGRGLALLSCHDPALDLLSVASFETDLTSGHDIRELAGPMTRGGVAPMAVKD